MHCHHHHHRHHPIAFWTAALFVGMLATAVITYMIVIVAVLWAAGIVGVVIYGITNQAVQARRARQLHR